MAFWLCSLFSLLLLGLYLAPLWGGARSARPAPTGRAQGAYQALEVDPRGLPSGFYSFYLQERRGRWRVQAAEMPPCAQLPPGLRRRGEGLYLPGRFESEEAALQAARQWADQNQCRLAGGL